MSNFKKKTDFPKGFPKGFSNLGSFQNTDSILWGREMVEIARPSVNW